jgi:threonine/homoserine efflux transporter RhtA
VVEVIAVEIAAAGVAAIAVGGIAAADANPINCKERLAWAALFLFYVLSEVTSGGKERSQRTISM